MRRLFLVLLLMFALPAMAEELTPQTVKNWLDSYQPIARWLNQHGQEVAKASPPGERRLTDEALKKSGNYDSLYMLLNTYHFANIKAWQSTSEKIYMAYVASQLRGQELNIDERIKKVTGDASMTEEKKSSLLNTLRATKNMYISARKVPQANIDAIQPYLQQLESLSGPH